MEPNHELRAAVAAHPGWQVVTIKHVLQSDGFQCGPWTHVALDLFVSYFKQGHFGGFGETIASHAELRPLNLIEVRGRLAMTTARAINNAFVLAVRTGCGGSSARRMQRALFPSSPYCIGMSPQALGPWPP